jgi:hypothetical protein
MTYLRLKRTVGISVFALAAILGVNSIGRAQDNRDRDNRNNTDRKRNDDRRDNNNNSGRYRVRRGGKNYDTDERGAELLRQAVNEGYRRGFEAGRSDRSSRRKNNWKRNNDYVSGNFGYDSHVDRGQYQYYFRQGFQKGYDDGYNSRNRYGSNNSVLGNILNQILNIQSY